MSAEFNTGTVAIETHGCKLNQADSEVLARRFMSAGYNVVPLGDGPDIYVLNSCTVTHVADAKARQALRAARRRNPSLTVVATGCYAQRAPDQLRRVEGVDLVLGNFEKSRIVEAVLQARGVTTVSCAEGKEGVIRSESLGRTRAMVKIQEGCNQVCAYCIVPKVRGRERSIPPEELVRHVRQRIGEGYKEVVLTGTQLGSYGFDLTEGTELKTLIETVLSRTEIERLRVSSLQPQEITPELLKLWKDPRLCPHFHMPLQNGSDAVLARMRRRYSANEYKETVERIYETVPHAAVTADVLVGFPGETEEDHCRSFSLCESVNFLSMHVFPYSVRPGTGAAHMDSFVNPVVKRKRKEEMLALARDKTVAFQQTSLGSVRPVLWERELDPGVHLGLTDNYLKVKAHSSEPLVNEISRARLVELSEETILAELV